MDKLRAIQLFVRLADLGSFTKVADELNVSKSMISKEISRLEDNLSARLLHRSTRTLTLTQVGEGYLERCREILMKMGDAESFVQDLQDKPKGKLKINAPMALGMTDLSLLFADFMEAYPEIELDINLSDDHIDLIEQGFDLGFRATSKLTDSNYIARPLTQFSYRVCAAKQYFDQHPVIKRADDLQGHNCFVYSYFSGKNVWPLGEGVSISGTLKVNSTPFMMEAIKKGLGIGFIPDFVCEEDVQQGKVIEILKDIQKPRLTLYAIYPARHFVPPKIKLCIEFLEQWFKRKF
ncbi:LysR family transcriptional regulator [Litoribacillus peritrichatus]|uniref:LysR family transcriptional regulator n=1 Tax=Litoribacillus peritrichatus TaxID=718191 RepID=A0ABP7MVW6_9GAMM